jgi:hypothetical protein
MLTRFREPSASPKSSVRALLRQNLVLAKVNPYHTF